MLTLFRRFGYANSGHLDARRTSLSLESWISRRSAVTQNAHPRRHEPSTTLTFLTTQDSWASAPKTPEAPYELSRNRPRSHLNSYRGGPASALICTQAEAQAHQQPHVSCKHRSQTRKAWGLIVIRR